MMRLTPELIDELDLKPGEVDLRLLTRWRFKTHFETCRPGSSQFAHAMAYDALAASEAAFLELTPQPHGDEAGIGSQSFAQIGFRSDRRCATLGPAFCKPAAATLWRCRP